MSQMQVSYLKHALVPQACVRQLVPCGPIAALAPAWDTPYIAFVDGAPMLRADWELVLEDGQSLAFVDVRALPQGGGGGGSDPMRMILTLGVMYFTAGLGGAMLGINGAAAVGSFGVGLANMAVTMAGMALVNAIAPPPKPTSPQQAAALAAPSPTYSLQAQGNSARLEAAIPEHFGRMLAYPDYAAQPYAEYAGNEQFLYTLLCIGRGEYEIEQIRIEDTPIANFEEITYEVIAPGGALSLFPANVISSVEIGGQDITATELGPFVAAAADTQANYLGIDYVYPRGIYHVNGSTGALETVSITVRAQAQAINAVGTAIGAWFDLGTEVVSAATTTPQRKSFRYAVTPGRYQVKVVRIDTKQTDSSYGHDVVWGGLRSYLQDSRTFGDTTLLAVRMRASSNLSQQASRKINVIATRKVPVYSGSTWSANTATRSPAWALAYAAKQVGLADTQIDLAALLALDATWAVRNDYFDARFDNFLSFWEAASKIAGAGRAKVYMQAGVLRVVRDQAATVPVALFGMRNMVKGSFSVNYLMPTADTADAINVGYFDSTNWAPLRVQAKLPGSTAAKPARIDLFGVTGRDHAFREGMYQAAANRYRRKIIKFTTEMEGFIPSFGDLVALQHDMPAWGQGGEVLAFNSGTRTLTLSEPPQWGAGTHYIGLRRRDGSMEGPFVVTAGTTANEVVLGSAPTFAIYTGGAEERTHYSFGWADTWRQLARVLAVRPRGLHLVELECVNEDDNVHSAEVGEITPTRQTSQLAGYTNAPVVSGLSARSMPAAPERMLLTWQPSAWADYYLVEQSSDGIEWTRTGETSTSNFTATALYGSATIVRVAAVGIAKGPWAQVYYGLAADYMWGAVDTALMWNASTTNLMWRY
jgi:hypothetical protein